MRYGDLKFYDKDFTPLAVFPRCTSVNWTLNFCGFGTAEIHMEKTEEVVRLLTENEYLFITQGDFQAVVTGIKIDTECVIFGKTPEWLLTKFLICNFRASNYISTGISASSVSCGAVKTAIGDKVTLITEPDESDESNKSGFFKEGAVSVYEIVESLLKSENLGFSFRFNVTDKSFTFKTLKGKENELLIISEEYKTSYDESFTVDLQKEASGGIYYHEPVYCGEWDADLNEPYLSVTPSNFGKYYTVITAGTKFGLTFSVGDKIFCTGKNGRFHRTKEAKAFPVTILPEDKGIFSWSAALDKTNENEANEELKGFKTEKITSFKTKNLVFGKDFSLGDILKTSYSSGDFCVTDKKIVTSVHLWEESGDFGCVPTLEKIIEEEN